MGSKPKASGGRAKNDPQTHPATTSKKKTAAQATHDTRSRTGSPDGGRGSNDTHDANASVTYSLLKIYADALDDIEKMRIATNNRIRALEEVKVGESLKVMGHSLYTLQEDLERLEPELVKALQKTMKQHPLGEWVEGQKGVGLKTAARLLAAIGDPADREMPSQLWSYCGYAVVNGEAPRLRKGQQANWNGEARKRAFLIAESCMKNRQSPYRALYDEGRKKYEDREGWTDGHKHMASLRLVSKKFLLDLWKEAKRLEAE